MSSWTRIYDKCWTRLSNEHNSPLPTRKVDFNPQSPYKNHKVRWRTHYGNMRWITTKQTRSLIFNMQNSLLIDLVLTDRRNLSVTRPKSAHGKSSSGRFSFSATRNASTKATKYVTFGFPFHILVFFLFEESLNVSVRKRYIFFSVLAAIIRKNFDKQTWIENGEGFTVHSSTWPSGAKGEWRISSWLAISNTREKTRIFSRVLLRLFSGLEILK